MVPLLLLLLPLASALVHDDCRLCPPSMQCVVESKQYVTCKCAANFKQYNTFLLPIPTDEALLQSLNDLNKFLNKSFVVTDQRGFTASFNESANEFEIDIADCYTHVYYDPRSNHKRMYHMTSVFKEFQASLSHRFSFIATLFCAVVLVGLFFAISYVIYKRKQQNKTHPAEAVAYNGAVNGEEEDKETNAFNGNGAVSFENPSFDI